MLEKIIKETGLTKAQISDIIVEALEHDPATCFDPQLIDELDITIEVTQGGE